MKSSFLVSKINLFELMREGKLRKDKLQINTRFIHK